MAESTGEPVSHHPVANGCDRHTLDTTLHPQRRRNHLCGGSRSHAARIGHCPRDSGDGIRESDPTASSSRPAPRRSHGPPTGYAGLAERIEPRPIIDGSSGAPPPLSCAAQPKQRLRTSGSVCHRMRSGTGLERRRGTRFCTRRLHEGDAGTEHPHRHDRWSQHGRPRVGRLRLRPREF